MKATKVMIASVCTFTLTWVILSLLFCYLFNAEFKESMKHCFIIMIVVGWIPSAIVGMDYSEKLNSNE